MAHDHHVLMQLTEAAVRQGDAAELARWQPRLSELAERDGHRLYQAIARRAQGVAARLAGQHAQAETWLRQALAAFTEMETRWQAGRTLMELGQMALAAGSRDVASGHFAAALAVFEALGALPDAEGARTALEEAQA